MSEAPRQTSRRDFLLGKSAAQALGDLVVPQPSGEAHAASDRDTPEHYLLHVGRQAMACRFEVYFNAGEYPQATEAALAALDLVDKLEAELSLFRSDSELSCINREAAAGPVHVEASLFEILELALRLSAETHGAMDITATPLWEVWGFSRRAGRVPTPTEIADAQQFVGSHLVELDPRGKTVRFAKPGVRLNLGCIGKGYALDCCARQLAAAGIEHFLIHGGQSSILARGHQGHFTSPFAPRKATPAPPEPDGGWVVGLPHPLCPDRRLAEIRLRNRALGTSGIQAQSFWHKGRRYGHIIDPRTGWPADGVLSASAVAPTAAMADALSTAFFVLPPDEALEYCRTRPELGAILLCPARSGGGLEAKTIGLSPDELTLEG